MRHLGQNGIEFCLIGTLCSGLQIIFSGNRRDFFGNRARYELIDRYALFSGQFFDVPVNYYVRVNFSSVIDIVDALGGTPPINLGIFMDSLPKFNEVNNA